MIAARQRMIDARSERIEQLLRVRAVLRAMLGDFLETLDPITNVRLVEVSAEGSKAHGDLSIALGFFEGTRLRLAVDKHARFSHAVSIPSAFDDVARILDVRVPNDLSAAEVSYEPSPAPGTRRTLDLVEVVMQLLAHAVASVEAEAPAAPARAASGVATARDPRIAVSGAKIASLPNPKTASPVAPAPLPAPASRLTLVDVVPPSDVLTFRVG